MRAARLQWILLSYENGCTLWRIARHLLHDPDQGYDAYNYLPAKKASVIVKKMVVFFGLLWEFYGAIMMLSVE
ncbi:hypothetical protein MMC2321_02638 [Chitinophaga sp. MM2321]